MKTSWMLIVVCLSVFYVTGCATSHQASFGLNGLPKEQYRVGGGMQIQYEVPADGVCYLVDVNTGKFLVTQTVTENDTFETKLPDRDDDKDVRGSLIKANLVLYFVPKSAEPEEPEQK